jgi:hypothetical protein
MINAKPIGASLSSVQALIGASWTALLLAAKGLRDRMAREIKTDILA